MPSSNQYQVISQASEQPIEIAFARLGNHFTNKTWLDINNRYIVDTISNLGKDSSSSNINYSDLLEYIAASAPLHCVDGWSFLGRAIDSHVRGDCDAATHFGYYAELRATMALLATRGIGIFNNKHFVVDSSSQFHELTGATHKVAWECLSNWAKSPNVSSASLVKSITIENRTLDDWLSAFSSTNSLQILIENWLETWGLDLKLISNDHELRNQSSYRPNQLNKRSVLSTPDASKFVRGLWTLYQPFSQSRFDNLDRHILRLSLEMWCHAVSGYKPSDKLSHFEARIDSMLRNLGLNNQTSHSMKDFLIRKRFPSNPTVFIEATQQDPASHPNHHIQVISRAALLLRIATGACSQLIRNSGTKSEDLEFWWFSLGVNRGLWKPTDPPETIEDLWEEIEEAIQSVGAWETQNLANSSYASWQRECARENSILSGCELIALWGLGF